jgi:hypothetical protein
MMAEQNNDAVQESSYLGMSDEEIMNAVIPTDVSTENEESEEEQQEESSDNEDSGTETQEAQESETEDADDEDADKASEEEAGDQEQETEAKDKKPDEKKPDEQAIDYEAEYKRLLAPFKANGREIAINSVDDAISLMQMGANYNKKMAALKPNLKLMKMLEHNGLLNDEKISFLIDLSKKNPDAINKLVKDSGIDPMDLDAEKAGAYKQSTYTVDDREIELDTVLDEIQETPSYARTLEIVSTKWDGASKQIVAQQPQLLKVINDHVQNGIYDLISKEIESERVFGRLNGLSDLEAYRQVGDMIQARGGFNHLFQGSSLNQGQPTARPAVVAPKPSKADEDKLKDKRRAASSTKPAASSSLPKDFNPLALSDEEFSKLVNNKLL